MARNEEEKPEMRSLWEKQMTLKFRWLKNVASNQCLETSPWNKASGTEWWSVKDGEKEEQRKQRWEIRKSPLEERPLSRCEMTRLIDGFLSNSKVKRSACFASAGVWWPRVIDFKMLQYADESVRREPDATMSNDSDLAYGSYWSRYRMFI